MRKIVNFIIIFTIFIFTIYFFIFYQGFYFKNPFKESKPEVVFYTKNEEIYVNDEPFVIKGVNIENFIPGHIPSDRAIDKNTFKRWFKQISDMGANTIKISSIYNNAFYDALYEFNKENEKPLYLLQGLQVSAYANNNKKDAYDKGFYGDLYLQSRFAVDVIHGKRNITTNTPTISGGIYRSDVSKYVLGYIIGSDWNNTTIAYTNKKEIAKTYRGMFLKTKEDSNAFEVMLTRLMDSLLVYESDKYGEIRLISFANNPECDPFKYDEGYDLLYGKFASIDIDNIEERNYNVLFACYDAYELCTNFEDELAERTLLKLEKRGVKFNNSTFLNGYLDILCQYHTCPVVVTSFGYSTSRGVTNNSAPFDEIKQGQMIIDDYENILKSGCQGGFIDAWQDAWTKRSFNTSYAIDLSHEEDWIDVQSTSQSKGILKFVPENENVTIDGAFLDFTDSINLGNFDNINLKYKLSDTYLYIYLSGQDFENKKAFLVFDITPNSGSKVYKDLTFDRNVDFVLEIDGKENTILFVQDRYDSLYENYEEILTGTDPFAHVPSADSNIFVPVSMLKQTEGIDRELKSTMLIDEYLDVVKFERFNTGHLLYGTNDETNKDYNSLADFCFGKDGVEIRIPWTLLNFSDPSRNLVHDDYYKHFGRENLKIDEIFIGAISEDVKGMPLKEIKLRSWSSNIKYTEKLKESYYIIKEAWTNGNK